MPNIDEHWTTDEPEPGVEYWMTKRRADGSWVKPSKGWAEWKNSAGAVVARPAICADSTSWEDLVLDHWIRSRAPIVPPPLPGGGKD